jgi:hypothetical protein
MCSASIMTVNMSMKLLLPIFRFLWIPSMSLSAASIMINASSLCRLLLVAEGGIFVLGNHRTTKSRPLCSDKFNSDIRADLGSCLEECPSLSRSAVATPRNPWVKMPKSVRIGM